MATTDRTGSRPFVRNSTSLVRSASAVDATIFNAVISAPIGSTLAWSIFFTLVAFPGADPVGVLILTAIINIPVLIMFALLGASMPLGCFPFWSLPSMIANTFMPIRSFFAWSFDRLMPEKLAGVNERTHSPVIAIVVVNVIIAGLTIWSVTSNVFQLLLGLIVLAGCLGVMIVAAAAIALPLRRPDLRAAPSCPSQRAVAARCAPGCP
jgi:amino acid transporter